MDATIISITTQCKQLESLDISQCPLLTEETGIEISKNCEVLKSLKAAYCASVITDNILRKVGESCNELFEFPAIFLLVFLGVIY